MHGHKLREARMRKGWSQEQAAEKVGVGMSTIQRWEQGRGQPHGYNRQRLCDVFGLTPEEVLGIEVPVPVEPPVASAQAASTRALQTFIKQDLTMHLWSLASQSHRTYREIHAAMVRILKDHEHMDHKNHHMTRRKALLRLVALPLATLGAATFTSEERLEPARAREVLMQCTVGIGACWELRRSTERSDLLKAFDGVSTYLPTLQRIVKDVSQHRQEAAGLVTQCLLLKASLAYHIENPLNAISYAQQALLYSQETRDFSLQLGGLRRLAVAYFHSKRNQQAWQTIEQAMPLLQQKNAPIPPRLQALIYGNLACNAARTGQDGSAYLEQANKLFAESDAEGPMYAKYDRGSLLRDTGIVHYQQSETTKALEAFSQLVDPETLSLQMPWGELGRIEIINYMTKVSLRSKDKDMEQTIHFWTEGIQGARALHSEQRFSEALSAYEVMETLWPDEKRIQELRDLIIHW